LAATCRLQNGGFHGCKTYQYKGKQELVYNNSPDTLRKSILPSFLIMLSNQEAKWMREFKVSKIQTAEWSQKIKVGDKGNESRIKI
jgi:hypothetical protein